MTSSLLLISLCLNFAAAQQDERGIGVKPSGQSQAAPPKQAQKGGVRPELVLQTGYGNILGASRFVFSPDGRLLATTVIGDSNVKLWEVATGRELRVLSGRAAAVYSTPLVAFSRDSRLVATTGGENTIKVWEVANGREVQTFAGHSGGILSAAGASFMAFGPDGRTLVAVSDAIRAWDVTTGAERSAADLSALGVGELGSASAFGSFGLSPAFALSPDGGQLAIVTTDNGSKAKVKFLDVATGREVRSVNLSGVENPSALYRSYPAFTRDGRLVVAAVDGGKLKLWDAGGKAQTLGAVPAGTSFVGISPGGELVAASVADYRIKAWDTTTGREVLTLDVPHGDTLKVGFSLAFGFSADGKLVATGGPDSPPTIWDAAAGKKLRALEGNSNVAYNVAFSADGTRLISGARTIWDLRTGQGLRVVAGAGRIYGLPTPDGKLLAVVDLNTNAVRVVETASGRTLHTLAPAAGGGHVAQVALSPDGRLLATSYIQSEEEMRGRANDNKNDEAMKASREALKKASKNPADLMKIYNQQLPGLKTGGIEGQIKIWDIATGREVRTLAAGDTITQLSFGDDGRRLVSLGTQDSVTIWDVTTGSPLQSFGQTSAQQIGGMMTGGVNSMQGMMENMMGAMTAGTAGRTTTSAALSPDSRLLATGGLRSQSDFNMSAMMAAAMSGRKKPEDIQKEMNAMFRNAKVVTTGQVTLFDAATGQPSGVLAGHGKGVEKVAFSTDGRLLASAATDNTIKVWDVSARREVRTLTGHTANVNSMAFSPDGRLLATAGDDGGTFLWDLQTGEHLATLISLFDGGDWLVVTPDGLFDGSPRAWNQILWRYDGNTFDVAPIEWFFNEFYYPALLSDIFNGKRPRAAQDISQKERRQPQVKLALGGAPGSPPVALTTRGVKVRIEVTDAATDAANPQGAGARDLRLFRNGSLVKAWRGDVLKGQQSATLEADLSLVAGENRLVAYAFNRDNVKSKDSQLTLMGDESLRRAGTLYVLAVGVNEYANPQFNLKYAVADAREFGAEVARQQTGLARFGRVEVVPLLDRDATKANILEALRRLSSGGGAPSLKAGVSQSLERFKPAQPEDAVVIYFAGHGTAEGQRFYLIPHDLGYMGSRGGIDAASLREMLAHSISDEELENAVEGLDAAQMLLVIDACNSGQALEAEEKRRGPMNSKGLAQLAYEKGMYVLTAAQSYQAALEAAQLGHGLLTYALVEEGLKAAAADGAPKDGMLFAREWFDYATLRVPQIQEEKMKQSRGLSIQIAFVEGEEKVSDPDRRNVQRPRVFYRRELEGNPLIVSRKQ